jgi:hypothetical protein
MNTDEIKTKLKDKKRSGDSLSVDNRALEVYMIDLFIKQLGCTPQAAAGIVGNLRLESAHYSYIDKANGTGAYGLAQWIDPIEKTNYDPANKALSDTYKRKIQKGEQTSAEERRAWLIHILFNDKPPVLKNNQPWQEGTHIDQFKTRGGRFTNLKKWCSDNGEDYRTIKGQLAFLIHELKTDYKTNTLVPMKSLTSIKKAATIFVQKFERPTQSQEEIPKRTLYGNHAYADWRYITNNNGTVDFDSAPSIEATDPDCDPRLAVVSDRPAVLDLPTAQPLQKVKVTQSPPSTFPKMKILDVPIDYPKGIKSTRKFNAQYIKAREDIAKDIIQIKEILNTYGIPLLCDFIDTRLDNKKISSLGRVGLQINLNPYAALTVDSNIETDDYFIGPDYTRRVPGGYGLKIYGNCKKVIDLNEIKYKPTKQVIDIYSIKNTYKLDKPEIIKIDRHVIDITQILKDFGFVASDPRLFFFKNSDPLLANWHIFTKPIKIVKGYSYKELLLTVYDRDKSSVWNEPDKFWDGKRFI